MASEVETILKRFVKLPEAERQQLLDQLALQNQSGTKHADRDIGMWAEAVYEALVSFFGAGGGVGLGPLPVRRLLAANAAWRPIDSFMKSSGFNDLKVVERQAVYRKLAELLVQYVNGICEHTGAPLSAKMIANCTGNIAGIFDTAFPGYLRSGLALVVARKIIGR